MKKVLATGLNGMSKTTAYLGSMDCFNRIRNNMDKFDGHSNLIDAIGRNFVDDDTFSLIQFPSITNIPPSEMIKVSAILCMSCPDIATQVLSIAEHYGIPIVIASMGINMEGGVPCDSVSKTNAEIMLSISQKRAVFHCCEEDENPFDALKIITEKDMEAGLYGLNQPELKAK